MAREARRRGEGRDKNLVGFLIGDVHYAVDIRRVKEILRPLPVVELPHAPHAVIGVADHRGEVVPVYDLRQRFGLSSVAVTRRTKWIIVMLPGRNLGLVVDAITEVFAAGEEDQRSVSAIGAGDAARGIVAVYGHRGALVFVLDVDRIGTAVELEMTSGRPRSSPALVAPRSGGSRPEGTGSYSPARDRGGS